MSNQGKNKTVPFISLAEKGKLEREHWGEPRVVNRAKPKAALSMNMNNFYKRRLAAVVDTLHKLEQLNITVTAININGTTPRITVARCYAVKQLGEAYQHRLRGAPSRITRYMQTTYKGCHIEWQAD